MPLPFPVQLDLLPGHVEVIDFDLDCVAPPHAVHVLSPGERVRAVQFRFERDRRRFVLAHAGLRSVLASCLGCDAGAVSIAARRKGKPELAAPHAETRFSLSHSGGRAVVAVARAIEIGIDLEEIRDGVEHVQVAGRSFTSREREAVVRAGGESLATFFRCWVLKEAYLKARGDGLSVSLSDFEVDPSRATDCLRWSSLGDQDRWRLEALAIDPPYVAALAGERGGWRVRRWSGIEGFDR